MVCAFARAAALMHAERFAEAAGSYAEAAEAARAPAPRNAVDGWRLASYCHERARQPAEAIGAALEALAQGEALAPDEREASTLADAGEALLALARAHVPQKVAEFEARVGRLLDADP